eukprot:5320175-Pyramimonas_sp.AAC.1
MFGAGAQHMPSVPEWLVNFVLGMMIPWVMKVVVKYMQTDFHKPESGYEAAMAKNKPFYKQIQDRVDDFLTTHMKGVYANDF